MSILATLLATVSIVAGAHAAVPDATAAMSDQSSTHTCLTTQKEHRRYATKVYARDEISRKAHHRLAVMRYCAGSKKALKNMKRLERKLNKERHARMRMYCGSTTCNRRLVYYLVSKHAGGSEARCAVVIIGRESGFNHRISNTAGSGAYGLPQALPGSKMSSHGADWQTNPATQIDWYIDYVDSRYGGSCGALAFWNDHHYY